MKSWAAPIRRLTAVFSVVILITLSGCMQTVKLNQRALVQAVGIDKEEDEIILTLEVFDGSSEDSSKNTIVSARGPNLSQAFDAASMTLGRHVFLGDNRIILIGRQAAEDGLRPIISYFNATHQSRPKVNVAVAAGKASDLIKEDEKTKKIPVDSLANTLDTEEKNAKVSHNDIMGLIRQMEETKGCAYAPAAHSPTKEEGQQQPSVEGSAVFRDGKLADFLPERETIGLMLVKGLASRTSLTAQDPELGSVSYYIYEVKSKIRPSIVDNAPRFQISLSVSAGVTEVLRQDGIGVQIDEIGKMEKILEEELNQILTGTIERLVYRDGVDLFDMGLALRRYLPDWWKANQDSWPSMMGSCSFEIDTNCVVNRISLETKLDHI